MTPGPVVRWTEKAETPAEERAAVALQALRAEPELEAAALTRIQNRIVVALRPRPLHLRRAAWRWQPALLALVTLGVAGIAAATIGAVVVSRKRVIEPLPTPTQPDKPHRGKARGPTIVPAAEEPPAAPPVEEVVEPPAPPPRAEAPAHHAAPASPLPEGDGEEVRMFSTAMRAWRAGDARGALAGVEDYQNIFPGGHFAHEVIVIKVDALQALGRSREALDFLRYLSLDRMPRAAELHVIRGELAAKAELCDEALVDFDSVLKRDPGGSLGARALYARASCRARLGDDVGAEVDLRLYLLRYPGGAHVTEVRRALAR